MKTEYKPDMRCISYLVCTLSLLQVSQNIQKKNENTINDYRLEDRIIRTHYQLKESARYSLNTVHG